MDKNEIPEMKIDKKPTSVQANAAQPSPTPQVSPEEQKKNMEKTKKELGKLKEFIVKKYKSTQAIGILPAQSIKFFIEEEEVPKESEGNIHLVVVVKDEAHKDIPNMTKEIIEQLDKIKTDQTVWVQVRASGEVWEMAMDQKFELSSAISMAYPLYDTGLLAGMRVAEIHKSLVLQKFEKYVVSYVLAGSLVRGEATEKSDVDVFVIINDTDVKRMSRLELKERLRGIILNYIGEAAAMAGVDPNKLNVQPYLLTDFWESVKDANPVMFTFIRDGVPLYDRGTFMPWKALLRMGKLKPSPEAIDMFMKAGERTRESVERKFLDLMVEIYWGVLTPSQALLMLSGEAPPSPKHTVSEMKRVFFTKEKMLEAKYIKFLEKVIGLYKDYEHQKIKTVPGKELDKLLTESEEYMARLKELREQIEKRISEKTIEQVYEELIKLLKNILGNKTPEKLVEAFDKVLVKSGKFTHRHTKILTKVIDARKEFKKVKSKANLNKVDKARRDATILMNDLVEYSQRIDLADMEKRKIEIKYDKDKTAELIVCDDCAFLFAEGLVKKLTDKVSDTTQEEIAKCISVKPEEVVMKPKYFELVRSIIGTFDAIL